MLGKQLQHGIAFVLQQHFFTMPANAAVADAEVPTNAGIVHTLCNKGKHLRPARCKAKRMSITNRQLTKSRKHFNTVAHVKKLPDIC